MGVTALFVKSTDSFLSFKYKVDCNIIVQAGRERERRQNMRLPQRFQHFQRVNVLSKDRVSIYSIAYSRGERNARIAASSTSGCFYLTVWNPANFVGGSSKSHIFSELFREAGTCEDFPIQPWENKKNEKLFVIFR